MILTLDVSVIEENITLILYIIFFTLEMQCFFPKEMKEYIRTMTCSVLLDLILILKAPITTKDVGFVLAIC